MRMFEDFNEFNKKEGKLIYPFDEITKFIKYFNSEWEGYPEKQGWAIFDSDTDIPNKKYWSDRIWMGKRVGGYYQVQKLDSPGEGEALIGKLKNDFEAYEMAKKLGLMVDEFGVIYGYKGKSFLK